MIKRFGERVNEKYEKGIKEERDYYRHMVLLLPFCKPGVYSLRHTLT